MTIFDISNHAVERFAERVREMPALRAREEMTHCLMAAKAKHLRRAQDKNRRTAMVPTGCCIFIFDHGTLVTCLAKNGKG